MFYHYRGNQSTLTVFIDGRTSHDCDAWIMIAQMKTLHNDNVRQSALERLIGYLGDAFPFPSFSTSLFHHGCCPKKVSSLLKSTNTIKTFGYKESLVMISMLLHFVNCHSCCGGTWSSFFNI